MTEHRILMGDVRKGLRLLPSGSVHVTITSPPYYKMRDYETGAWEGGNPDCEHDTVTARKVRGGHGSDSKNTKKVYPKEFSAGACSKCGARYIDDQIGQEETPELYVQHMVEVSREVWRVLRDDGTYFINIADKYTDSGCGPTGETGIGNQEERQGFVNKKSGIPAGMKEKDLMGIPWMLAQALRADGWYWRKWFPWIKRNVLPESVDDRPVTSLEIILMLAKSGATKYWTHPDHNAVRVKPVPDYRYRNRETGETTAVEPENWKTLRCIFDKRKRLWARRNLWEGKDYFWDADAIRMKQSENTHSRGSTGSCKKVAEEGSNIRHKQSWIDSTLETEVPGGRNRRDSDWFFESVALIAMEEIKQVLYGLMLDEAGDPVAMLVNPEQFEEKHFAVYPQEMVKPLILGGSSEKGCCPACGAPWVRIVEKGDPNEDWKRACGADVEGGYNGVSWKYEKLIHGKRGHFHEKEKKQDALGKPNYTGFNERWQQNASDVKRRILNGMKVRESHWVPSCDCNAGEPIPCTVLDPFLGRGTTTKVASDNGRSSVGCELSEEYIIIMRKWMNIHQTELDSGMTVATYTFEKVPQ